MCVFFPFPSSAYLLGRITEAVRAVVSSIGGAVLPFCAGRALGSPGKAWEWKPDRGRRVWAGLVVLRDVRFRENKLNIKNKKWQIVFHLSLTIKSESGLY